MALPDMPSRLRSLLPSSWFGQGAAPVRDAVLAAFGAPVSWAYGLYSFVLAQSRLATSSGIFIDLFALDFFGRGLPRRTGETDNSYGARVALELTRPRTTRAAVSKALQDLTGRAPQLIEPWNPGDCAALGYTFGVGLGAPLGSLSLTDQVFVLINPPNPRFWIDTFPGLSIFGFDTGFSSPPVRSGAWVEFAPGLSIFGYGLPVVVDTGLAQPNAGVAGVETSAGGVGVGSFTPVSAANAGSITNAEIYGTVLRNIAGGIRAWVRIN